MTALTRRLARHRFFPLTAVMLAAAILSGCGLIGSRKPPEAGDGKPVIEANQLQPANQGSFVSPEAAPTPLPAAPSRTNVELVWQVPEDPVDGFIVHYGFQRGSLDHEIKVPSAQLERFEDPSYGFVFRYVLKEVPADETVYVAIAAYKGNTVSQTGDVFEVKP
jgi:hypothetical protein